MEKPVKTWVSDATADQQDFRKAVHITLMAISICEELSESMVMKGGMLMGIGYGSSRYTTDIDFSTSKKLDIEDPENFKLNLNNKLKEANADLLYDVECKIQSVKIKPNIKATFPSLKVTIGYANKKNINAIKRLENGQSSNTISIDYSFNEETGSVDELLIDGSEKISVYSLESMISEKYRSVLQQVERNRSRRQDIYDLYYLITNHAKRDINEKTKVLEYLFLKSQGKNIDEFLIPTALDSKEIRTRSERGYGDIADEIEGPLPEFNVAYATAKIYYEELPWDFHI